VTRANVPRGHGPAGSTTLTSLPLARWAVALILPV
jgi:hypothetical protein